MRHVKLKIALIILLASAVPVLQAAPNETPGTRQAQPRPAAQGESPEEVRFKEMPAPAKRARTFTVTPEQAQNACAQDSECRKAMQAIARDKKPGNPRAAAKGDSPEEMALKELRNPSSSKQSKRWLDHVEDILAWFSPISSAHAATTAATWDGAHMALSTQDPRDSKTNSILSLYGALLYGYYGRHVLYGYDGCTGCSTRSENKPFAYLRLSLPTSGYYILGFQAQGGPAKLRHQYNGPIIKTWSASQLDKYGNHNYTTIEYLNAGIHYFYFWPDSRYIFFDGVTITLKK